MSGTQMGPEVGAEEPTLGTEGSPSPDAAGENAAESSQQDGAKKDTEFPRGRFPLERKKVQMMMDQSSITIR